MNNLDSVLLPYANDQPKNLSMPTKFIERIPSLATPNGINPKFQKFYDHLCSAITAQDVEKLYDLSDKCLPYGQFYAVYRRQVGIALENLMFTSRALWGMDIELNIQRFQGAYRNIVGSFFVSTYEVLLPENFGLVNLNTSVVRKSTEIFFTYKNENFELISVFNPFAIEED